MSEGLAHPEPAPARDAPAVIHLPHVPLPDTEKKRPKRQRGHVEQFRTDDEEHAALMILAHEAGLSLGAYYRRELIGIAGARSKRALPTETSRLRAQHLTAINRIGNLVNQGIYALNRIDPETAGRDRLADEVAAARELLQAAMPALREALAAVLSGDDCQG
jgi:hypothetical protein